jgi:hypothetical protein
MNHVVGWEYFLWVFVSVIGVLQLAATFAQLKGLLFFESRVLTFLFSFLAIGLSFGFFFGWDNRLDTTMRRVGLEGSQQLLYLFLGTLAGGIFTLTVSSLLKAYQWRERSTEKRSGQGVDALKEMSYFEAIKQSFKAKETKIDEYSRREDTSLD